ncbi:uncharacterized protein SAPINGB_P002277 [Magnusiomyces paraingens]|uniref:Uncharacterized protein n=1 Tax=Magnusiomyces paraingens TaxID=2606893 RepID=A0A5E8BIQ2_9ASCO|nr:uncharacterized protein SAPINGB_P002277 [Saprochaete ingens]VVT49453.1 unnamed protein product [Saprochaete ingens]
MIFNALSLCIIAIATTVSAQHGPVSCDSTCYWAGYLWYHNNGFDILTSSGSVNETIKHSVCTTTFTNQAISCGNSSYCDISARESSSYLKQTADVCGFNFDTSDFGDSTGFWIEDDYCASACGYIENLYTNCTTTEGKILNECLCLSSTNWASLCGSEVCSSARQNYLTGIEAAYDYCNWTLEADAVVSSGSSVATSAVSSTSIIATSSQVVTSSLASSEITSSLASSLESSSILASSSSSEIPSTQETNSVEFISSAETSSTKPSTTTATLSATTTSVESKESSTSSVSTQRPTNGTSVTTAVPTTSQTTSVVSSNEASVALVKSTPALILGLALGLLMA